MMCAAGELCCLFKQHIHFAMLTSFVARPASALCVFSMQPILFLPLASVQLFWFLVYIVTEIYVFAETFLHHSTNPAVHYIKDHTTMGGSITYLVITDTNPVDCLGLP